MRIEGKRFTPEQNFGDGVIGPSMRDHVRANLSYGRDLLNLSRTNPLIELGRRNAQRALQALILGASLFTGSVGADAARPSPDLQTYVSSISSDWKPLSIDSLAAFERLRYKDLAEVAKIHGGGDPNNRASNPDNWEFIDSEFGFAAKLKEDPNGNDTFISLDVNTIAEGYQYLAEPGDPKGFREQRIVVGPGQQGIWVKGILVRRDRSADEVYKFVLSKRTSDTVAENAANGTNHTVLGIDGFRGKGDIKDPRGFRRNSYSGGLAEVAQRYGGNADDYKWVPGEEGSAARFKFDSPGHRLVFLDQNTVLEGSQLLWSPNSVREQRIVVDGNGQNGLYILNGNFRPDERTDILYKYIYGTKLANTIIENIKNGTNISVIGVNGFRGGEK